MKFLTGAASLLALALFAVPALAQDSQPATDQPATEQIAPATQAVPEAVLALLSDTRALTDLSVDELKTRAKQARRFSKDENLTQDMRSQLKAIAEAARGELDARNQAAQPAPEPAAPVAETPAVQPEAKAAAPLAEAPVVEAPAAPAPVAEAPAAQPIPDAVQALLSDNRPLSDLSVDELKGRAKSARRFSKDDNLPQDVRDQLEAIAKAAREEVVARDQQNQQAAPAPAAQPPAVVQEAQPAAPAVEPAPAAPAPAIVQEAPPPPATDAPAVAQQAPVAPAQAPAAADIKALDSNAGDPASEKQAQIYLADATPLENLSDEQLRTRLDDVRNLMSGNELSRDTERAVRKKLKTERDVLRQRLAVVEAAAQAKQAQAAPPVAAPTPDANIVAAALPPVPVQPPAPPTPPAAAAGGTTTVTNNTVNNTVNNTLIITNVTPVSVVLQDRRPPEELQVVELQRRVQVYNDAQYNQDYDAANRDYWRASVARDREILRRRMIAERHRREAELAISASNDNLDISINLDFSPSRPPPPRDVFAAEVDDQQLEEILVAPPRHSIKQRYTLDEIAVKPQLRDTVSRIEIDTIRFGSNEAFIREEQVNSLDGIAAIIERIVKKYPNEVFMIEGHTDAVGADAYNIRLSKLRAEAVKKALTSYYVIPAQNLRTVGLGERFLKIPTAEAEPENRRVSISRVTQLLGNNQ
jgi:outer membrane protein OmpA-like peptidoglycan-associated protein